ncbi:MAG: hypothetical protein ACYC0T_04635 [Ramlibacter sp.]
MSTSRTSSYLANFNVTIEQARDFVFAHLDEPTTIFTTARQYGITNEMLGEIAGYSADEVRGFFGSFSINAGELDPEPLFPSDMLQFSSLIALNTATTGALSTASLREQVIAQTGESAYNAAFDPNQFFGGLDGVFTASDLGITELGDLAATAETLESLFYGSIVHLASTVDTQELAEIGNFVQANAAGLANGDPAVMTALLTLVQGVVEDLATQPAFSEPMISEVAVASAVALVGFASQHDQSLFDELLSGFGFVF